MILFMVKLVVLFIVTFALMHMAKFFMRKIFHLPTIREDDPSRNYVRQRHELVDKPFRDYAYVILFILLIVNLMYFPASNQLLPAAVLLLLFLRMSIKAFFEWKYFKYPKQYLLTITEIVVLFIVIMTVMKFDLLS